MRKGSVIGTLSDRVDVIKSSVGSDPIAVAVVKATNNDICAPKRKHVENILHQVYGGAVSPSELCKQLYERLSTKNWVTVFKTLIVFHILMRDGGDRFNQYLGNSKLNFNVFNFLDKTSPQAIDMSGFIRRYAKFLEERVSVSQQLDFDPIKKQPNVDQHIKKLPVGQLFAELHHLQILVDALLQMEAREDEMNNYVISAAFVYLLKDLIKLYAVLNDYVIRILEMFFDMDKTGAKQALEIYKKYLEETKIVMKFMEVAKVTHIVDDDEVPDLSLAPTALLKALEDHVRSFDVKIAGYDSTPTKSTDTPVTATRSSSVPTTSSASSSTAPSSSSNFASFHQQMGSSSSSSAKQSTAAPPARPNPPASTASNNNKAVDLFHEAPSLSKQVDLLSLDDFDPIVGKGAQSQPQPTITNMRASAPNAFPTPQSNTSTPFTNNAFAPQPQRPQQQQQQQQQQPQQQQKQQQNVFGNNFFAPQPQQPFQSPFGAVPQQQQQQQPQPFYQPQVQVQQHPFGSPFGSPQPQHPFGYSQQPQYQAQPFPQQQPQLANPFAPQQQQRPPQNPFNPFG